jgi:hypothetical protein
MTWLVNVGRYLWIVFGNFWGIVIVLVGALDLWERLFDHKARIPAWVRIGVLVGVVFVAQGLAYENLSARPTTLLRVPAPPAPIIQVTETHKRPAGPKTEQSQSGHDNIQSGPITQAPCSALQQGGSGNEASINCEPPPLKLNWSVEAMPPNDKFSNRQRISVISNVDFHPVSFVIVCDHDIKAVDVFGVFSGANAWGIMPGRANIGYVYFDNPSLAPGVPLRVLVSADKPFNILRVQQARLALSRQ